MNELRVGQRIVWLSAKGRLFGEVKEIYLKKNAADDLVPWLLVSSECGTVVLCATDANVKMMHIELAEVEQ